MATDSQDLTRGIYTDATDVHGDEEYKCTYKNKYSSKIQMKNKKKQISVLKYKYKKQYRSKYKYNGKASINKN